MIMATIVGPRGQSAAAAQFRADRAIWLAHPSIGPATVVCGPVWGRDVLQVQSDLMRFNIQDAEKWRPSGLVRPAWSRRTTRGPTCFYSLRECRMRVQVVTHARLDQHGVWAYGHQHQYHQRDRHQHQLQQRPAPCLATGRYLGYSGVGCGVAVLLVRPARSFRIRRCHSRRRSSGGQIGPAGRVG
jgi:hypothetical protein